MIVGSQVQVLAFRMGGTYGSYDHIYIYTRLVRFHAKEIYKCLTRYFNASGCGHCLPA